MTKSLTKAALCAAALISLSAPAQAAVVVGGSDLLTPTHAAQMETWLTGDARLGYTGPLTFTNLFDKASGDTSLDFHAAVDNQGPTFFVTQATIVGSGVSYLIGGFNPGSWTSDEVWTPAPSVGDRVAFIFNLITANKWLIAQDSSANNQTGNFSSKGPMFGSGQDFRVNGDLSSGSMFAYSYCLDPAPGQCYGGANVMWQSSTSASTQVTYGALEVFTIAAATVPIPAAAPLLLGALGLTGLIARRRKS